MNQNDVRGAIDYYRQKSKLSIGKRAERNVLQQMAKIALVALEKQKPKPPEHKVHEKYKALGKNYYCHCGVMFVDFEKNGTNYCGNCGQKLKEDKQCYK